MICRRIIGVHQDSCLVPPCRPSSPKPPRMLLACKSKKESTRNEIDVSGYEEFVVQVDRTFGDEAELEIDSGDFKVSW